MIFLITHRLKSVSFGKFIHEWSKIFVLNLYHACFKAIVLIADIALLTGGFKLVLKWVSSVIFVLGAHNS